jgi:hypothetical protein
MLAPGGSPMERGRWRSRPTTTIAYVENLAAALLVPPATTACQLGVHAGLTLSIHTLSSVINGELTTMEAANAQQSGLYQPMSQ